MSIRLMTAVWQRSPYKGGSLLAHLALADWANDEGFCWPLQREVAHKARVEERQARNILQRLEDDGTIERAGKHGRATIWLVRAQPAKTAGQDSPAIDDTQTGNAEPPNRQSTTPTPMNRQNRQEPSTPAIVERPDVERLCLILTEAIVANGGRKPTITKAWRDAARLLLDRDGIGYEEAEAVLRWSQQDDFWRANILSMPTFRRQYDKLKLHAARRPIGQRGVAAAMMERAIQQGGGGE